MSFCTDLKIICKLDYQSYDISYDIMQIFKDGGHTVSNLLPVSGFVTTHV